MINDFIDIPDLNFVYNASDRQTLELSGTDVLSIVPHRSVGEEAILVPTQNSPTYIPEGIGAMGSIEFLLMEDALRGYLTDGRHPGDYTWFYVGYVYSNSVGVRAWTIEEDRMEGVDLMSSLRAGSNHAVRMGNSTGNTNITREIDTPFVQWTTLSFNPEGTNELRTYVNGVEGTTHEPGNPYPGDQGLLTLGGRFLEDTGDGYNGRFGLMALYDRVLTPEEQNDVYELCQYWIANGKGPDEPDYPTSTEFTAAVSLDVAELSWWWAPADEEENEALYDPHKRNEWEDALVRLDASVAPHEGNPRGKLIVHSGKPEDTGYIKCTATAPHMTLDSDTARFTVRKV